MCSVDNSLTLRVLLGHLQNLCVIRVLGGLFPKLRVVRVLRVLDVLQLLDARLPKSDIVRWI